MSTTTMFFYLCLRYIQNVCAIGSWCCHIAASRHIKMYADSVNIKPSRKASMQMHTRRQWLKRKRKIPFKLKGQYQKRDTRRDTHTKQHSLQNSKAERKKREKSKRMR